MSCVRVLLQRYSALFALRNKGGKDSVGALGAVFKARSALLKHEVAYVMGQMQDAQAVEFLVQVLKVRGHSSGNALQLMPTPAHCV